MAGDVNDMILIVGAGPSGLALAVELARRGVACRVVERAEGPTDQSRALGLTARTLECFHQMGLSAPVLDEGRVLHGFRVHADGGRSAGTSIGRLSFDLDPAETRFPFELVLPQNRTVHHLARRFEDLGGRIEYGTELIHLDARADGVEARLLRTGSDRVEPLACAYAVGADGSGSLVRRLAGLAFAGMDYEERFLLADAAVRWPLAADEAHMFLRREGPVVAFPYPTPGRWRLIDTSGLAQTGDPAPTLARFRDILGQQVPGAVVEDPTWTSLFRIHRRLAERYRRGRLILLGDAAHIHSPASGQGLNTGVGDAFNLGWKLALVLAGHAPDALLDSYEPERRPVAAEVLNDSSRITDGVLLDNAVAERLRDWAVGLALSFDGLQRRIAHGMSKLGVAYRDSPIVRGDGPGGRGPRAGDRAPDAALDGGRLYDLFAGSTGHTLLVFAGLDDAGARALAADLAAYPPEVLRVRVLGSDAAARAAGQAYRVEASGVALVRPDLHLAYRGAGLSARPVREALGLVFEAPDRRRAA